MLLVAGSVNELPAHTGVICVKSGMMAFVMVTVIVAVVAQTFAAGVNVYVVVALVFIAGDHVPEIPFVDVAGKVNDCP